MSLKLETGSAVQRKSNVWRMDPPHPGSGPNVGPLWPSTGIPVYCVGMQPGNNSVYSAPVNHGATGPTLPPVPILMPSPGRPAGCPPGLEYLIQTDQVLIHQRVDLAEMVIGWEMNNVYTVKNSMGQQVFVAAEENDIFTMQVCGPARPFTIHLHDNMGQEVLTLIRPLRCGSCCFPCCLQELEVQMPRLLKCFKANSTCWKFGICH
uniref:Phospholipid scramblase n=1 Tax=Amphiprion percula TaxID=161767 RepID=A0A3P8SCE2_AMPPE